MRRKDREITNRAEIEAILFREETGYLASCGDDGQPMATPVNYVYLDGQVIIHCALTGRKLENIARNPKVGFTVTADISIDRVMMTTYYSSVMVEGIARLVTDEGMKKRAISGLTERLAEPGEACNDAEGRRTAIIAIEITSISGKKNIRKM